jgi:hypothetical protein
MDEQINQTKPNIKLNVEQYIYFIHADTNTIKFTFVVYVRIKIL